MRKMGRKELRIQLHDPIDTLPEPLKAQGLELVNGSMLRYEYDTQAGNVDVAPVLAAISDAGLRFRDLETTESSLEDIFVDLVGDKS
jgi:ABC-2 type transport system ATP-binding protein